MSNFTAIDFETATGYRSSVCQIGLVVVENCKIVERIKHLVQPPNNIYNGRNIDIHGITPEATAAALTFAQLYPDIQKYIDGKDLVAHNAGFEIGCLSDTLTYYSIKVPLVHWYCTRKIYNLSLAEACKRYGIVYTPHDALSDAEACALLMIKDILK
jgi:DNA polymerase-3 subunit epsilon